MTIERQHNSDKISQLAGSMHISFCLCTRLLRNDRQGCYGELEAQQIQTAVTLRKNKNKNTKKNIIQADNSARGS